MNHVSSVSRNRPLPAQVRLQGVPPHIESWIAAKITGFVPALLKRWQRGRTGLPPHFSLVICPVAEINSRGGLPDRVIELTDPRLSCRHFTGCLRPYYAVIFTGPDADRRRREAIGLLPWSESYEVGIDGDAITLSFAGATEELDEEGVDVPRDRRLQQLIETGELLRILD